MWPWSTKPVLSLRGIFVAIAKNTLAASENLGSWLVASLPCQAMTSKGSVFARRHLMKLISDRLLRQRNGLMIYNKIERVLVITKQIFNHYNTDFSIEITSKVQKVSQKYTFTHKLTTKRNFQTPSLFFSSTIMEWCAQDCGISKAAKDTSMLPSKIDQMKDLMRQEVKLTLDSDVPWCLPSMKCVLRRQPFSVFGCSHCMGQNYIFFFYAKNY